MPIFRRTKTYVTAYGVLRWFCWMWLVAAVGRCVVALLASYNTGETEVNNKHLIVASCWFFLCLHTLLMMHGHRNLKNSTCFGKYLCPSSGIQHCTHINGICHTGHADWLLASSQQNLYVLLCVQC
jgi:hypothetical protein